LAGKYLLKIRNAIGRNGYHAGAIKKAGPNGPASRFHSIKGIKYYL